jgi:hypothetical protein
MRVHIDAVDAGRIVNHIVERIASGARDHHDPVAWADIQYLIIDCRIFPTLVVNEISRMDLIEEPTR